MSTGYQAVIAAPFGALGLRMVDGVLAGIDFLPAGTRLQAPGDAAMQAIGESLAGYLHNPHQAFDFPLRTAGTAFQQRVWAAIRAITVGQTLTYSELAQRVGSGPRAVANACGANPIPIVIPCHRVVAKSGLGGFMQGREVDSLSIKQWLLAHERG
jgi:methylated-DNA-[protein]-cysteine S-methyltransferase